MDSAFISAKNLGSFNNLFGNWNRRERQTALKIAALIFLAFAFTVFPVRVLEGYFKASAPEIAPTKAIDPQKIEALMKSLVIAKAPTCVNPVPLRCESPMTGVEKGA